MNLNSNSWLNKLIKAEMLATYVHKFLSSRKEARFLEKTRITTSLNQIIQSNQHFPKLASSLELIPLKELLNSTNKSIRNHYQSARIHKTSNGSREG